MAAEGKAYVLVIDDEPDARALVKMVLESSGYAVCGAEDGEGGLRLLSEQDEGGAGGPPHAGYERQGFPGCPFLPRRAAESGATGAASRS